MGHYTVRDASIFYSGWLREAELKIPKRGEE
jgi:hypothetical protein